MERRWSLFLSLLVGIEGIAATLYVSTGYWQADHLKNHCQLTMGQAKVACTTACLVATGIAFSVVFILSLCVINMIRRPRVGEAPKWPRQQVDGMTEGQAIDALLGSFRWLRTAIRCLADEIAGERIVCRKAMRHHLESLLEIQAAARRRVGPIGRLTERFTHAPWSVFGRIYESTVDQMGAAAKPLGRCFGKPRNVLRESAGVLYPLAAKLQKTCQRMNRVTKKHRKGEAAD